MVIKYFWIILLFILNIVNVFSQNRIGYPYIRNYSKSEYNASPRNNYIVQDKRGVMYFANADGILSFDGKIWELNQLPGKTKPFSVFISSNNVIYWGGESEFGYITYDDKGERKLISLVEKIPSKYRNFAGIWQIFEYKGSIVFNTYEGLYILKDGRVEFVASKTQSEFAFCLNNNLYVTMIGVGLCKLENKALVLVKGGDLFKDNFVNVMLPYSGDTVLVATKDNGLYFYDGKKFTYWQNQSENFFKSNLIVGGTVFNKTNFIFVSRQNGIIMIDKKGKTTLRVDQNTGLQDNTILYTYIDTFGGLWLGLNNGIDYINLNSPYYYIDKNSGVYGAGYTSLYHKGKLYLGTTNAALSRDLYSDDKMFKEVKNFKGQTYKISTIDDNLFLSSHEGGFLIKDNVAEMFTSNTGAWLPIKLRNKPDKLILGYYKGLLLFDKDKNGKIKLNTPIKGFHESARFIYQDLKDDKILWISHGYKGIYKLELNDALDSVVKSKLYNSFNGFPSDYNITVYNIDNELICTSSKGLFIYNAKKDRFEHYSKFDKLLGADCFINYFTQDKEGNLWYIQNNFPGILRKIGNGAYYKDGNSFKEMKVNPIKTFEHINVIDSNNVIFGAETGFVHYNPSLHIRKKFKYFAFVDRVELVKQTVKKVFEGNFTDEKGNLCNMQVASKIPEFKPNENAFRISYTATYYEGINNIKYKIILEGFDKEWSDWSVQHIKEYTNLPAGSYTFKVIAKNINDEESIVGTYVFIIDTHWYLTWWAYILYAIAIAGLVYLIVILNLKRLREANQHLEKLVKKRTLEIAQQNEEIKAQSDQIASVNDELANANEELKSINEQLAFTIDELGQKNLLITDSISYAKRIQRAILPSEKNIRELFPESYIHFRPKDIVSGDFYWFKKIDDKIFFTVADCTGHGVPGAFMSIIAYDLLHRILKDYRISKASDVLNHLKRLLPQTLRYVVDSNEEIKDGIDLALCMYDETKKQLHFSGARNPLYIIRDNQLIEFKADKIPIDNVEVPSDSFKFTNHLIEIKEGDSLYIFSDGFVDQKGGPKGKKFYYGPFRELLLEIHLLDFKEQQKQLESIYENWKGSNDQVDDVLILNIRF